MGQFCVVGLIETLIKEQNTENFRYADTLQQLGCEDAVPAGKFTIGYSVEWCRYKGRIGNCCQDRIGTSVVALTQLWCHVGY